MLQNTVSRIDTGKRFFCLVSSSLHAITSTRPGNESLPLFPAGPPLGTGRLPRLPRAFSSPGQTASARSACPHCRAAPSLRPALGPSSGLAQAGPRLSQTGGSRAGLSAPGGVSWERSGGGESPPWPAGPAPFAAAWGMGGFLGCELTLWLMSNLSPKSFALLLSVQ